MSEPNGGYLIPPVIEVPDGLLQDLKRRWLPSWALRLWPVRVRRIDTVAEIHKLIDVHTERHRKSRTISSLGGSDDMQTAKRPTNGIGCPECEGSRRSAGERSFRATIVCEHGREVVTGGTLITLEEDLPGPPKP